MQGLESGPREESRSKAGGRGAHPAWLLPPPLTGPWQLYPGPGSSGSGPGNGYGASIGNKRIMLLQPRTVVAMRLTVTALVHEAFAPVIANFAGFAPCAAPDE